MLIRAILLHRVICMTFSLRLTGLRVTEPLASRVGRAMTLKIFMIYPPFLKTVHSYKWSLPLRVL